MHAPPFTLDKRPRKEHLSITGMFTLPNLVSTAVSRSDPWDFTGRDQVPPRALTDKAFRTHWMQQPETNYPAYSLFEGLNAGARLKGPSSADEGNPPIKMYGLAADYDLKLSAEEVHLAIARMPIKPNFYEVSLSGNARLIWLFETPIYLLSYAFAVFLLTKIPDFIPVKQLAGLDEGALKAPDRYFTNGGIWNRISETPVPNGLIKGFLIEVSAKYDWLAPENGPTVPMDALVPELRKKYPNFDQWNGKFEVGAQGPSFWVSGSQSPMSAIVRETGIQTFSAHASKPFFNWSELLGHEFVSAFKQKQMGEAVTDIYYDEKNYFSRMADRSWAIDNKDNLTLFLKSCKGLSDRVRKGENTSEVDDAISFVHRQQRVRTAASFAFYPEGVNVFNGERILNTHTRRAILPSTNPAPWGVSFPWLAEFLDKLFNPAEQLPYFLSWLAHFYQSCHARTPRSGHALFIAGGTNVGKTFLNRAVIGGLVGGFGECNEFMMGSDSFNAELFDFALWCVDDGSMAVDFKSQKRFSEMVKRCVANPSFRLNGKFLKAVNVKWQGRVVATLNLDAESLRLLPDLELSLKEKIMLLKTVSASMVQFLGQTQMEDILTRELPYLARFLIDYEFPNHTLANDPRFYVVPYHEESLVGNANQSSASGAFSEILSEFLDEYFKTETKDAWAGTALQLHKQIMADPTMGLIMHRYDPQMIGRQLSTLANKSTFDIVIDSVEGKRRFTVSRGNRPSNKPTNGHTVPQAENSVFQKL